MIFNDDVQGGSETAGVEKDNTGIEFIPESVIVHLLSHNSLLCTYIAFANMFAFFMMIIINNYLK